MAVTEIGPRFYRRQHWYREIVVFSKRVRLWARFGAWPPYEAALLDLRAPTEDDIRWAREQLVKRGRERDGR